jgi:hypothetical protein
MMVAFVEYLLASNVSTNLLIGEIPENGVLEKFNATS